MAQDPNIPPIDDFPGPGNTAVTIITTSLTVGNVGLPYFEDLDGGGGTPPYTWGLVFGALPPGLSLDVSGYISGTPTTSGTFVFSIRVQDIIGSSFTRSLTIQIDPSTNPEIITISIPPGPINVPYSTTLTAIGGTPPYVSWLVMGGLLPAGLTLNSGGVISGTPTVPGTFIFLVQVTDSNTLTDTQGYELIIQSVTPIITTTSLPNGTTGVAYSTTISASGGTTPYTNWQVISGSLPNGLLLISSPTTAIITGTPTEAGNFVFTVQVTDSLGGIDTQIFNLIIANGGIPTIYTNTLPFAPLNTPYSTTIQASGGSLPYTWSILSGNFPTSLTFDPLTGVISGTPTTIGSYVFTVKVVDFSGNIYTKLFTLIVGNFILPSITTSSLMNGAQGFSYSDFVQGLGGQSPYTWGVIGTFPPGLTINPITGEVSGIPTTPGTYSFDIILTDTNSNVDIQTFTIDIGVTTNPIITTTSLPSGSLGIDYTKTLQAVSGVPGYTWLILSGIAPTGLTLSSSGVLSGIPTVIGVYNFTVRVTDSTGATDTQLYSLVIGGEGFDSNCCFCVYTDTLVNFTNNSPNGVLSASGGTIVSNTQWLSPSTKGIFIITLTVDGTNGQKVVSNTITVVEKLTVLNVENQLINQLLPGGSLLLQTNYPANEVEWKTLGDCGPIVTPGGNIMLNTNPADQCFGAIDCTIRGTVLNTDCTNLTNFIDIRIKVNPVYPTPDNCGPYITKWLRDGTRYNVIKTEFEGGCDETHLKNRVPIVSWTLTYDGLSLYKTEDTDCPLCYSCILFCGCKEKPPIYSDSCHPIMRSANRLDDFWNLVYGEYKAFTLVDYDTGEIWYNVKFNDQMNFDHRHRRNANSRNVKLIWRPCCESTSTSNIVGGACGKHGIINYKPSIQECMPKKECE